MPRIRSVKPDFFLSESVAELTFRQRLLWVGLWTYVDDDGRGRDNPRLIKAAVFPLDDDVIVNEVDDDLRELAKRGRIGRYEVAGRAYLWITNWREHQRIDKPTKSKIPPPPDPEPPGRTPGGLREDSGSRGGEQIPLDDASPQVRGSDARLREDSGRTPGDIAEDSRLEGRGGERSREGKGAGRGGGGERARTAPRPDGAAQTDPPTDPHHPRQLCGRQHDPEPDCRACGHARRAGVTHADIRGGPRPGTDTKTAGWAAVRDQLAAREREAEIIRLPGSTA